MPNKTEDIKFGSRSLILWLQAYDLLKASYEITELRNDNRYVWGFGDSDRNLHSTSPRNKLRKLSRDLYRESNGLTGIVEHRTGWKKNHGIAAASCLLLAAQVLNDAGVETNVLKGNFLFRLFGGPGYNPTYSPIKWNKLGNEGLIDNLFEGKHAIGFNNVPQAPLNTAPDDYSVYAEGIAYASYGLFDCGIPAFRAQSNLYPIWTDEIFLKKNEIKNIFNWADRLRIGNSANWPTFDNSGNSNACLLSLTGINKFNYEFLDINYGPFAAYLADYIAIIAGNKIDVSKDIPKKIDPMLESGNIIVRSENSISKQHFMLLCENGIANDVPSNSFDDTHEDADMGSFTIYAGKDFESMVPLVIDPPYFGFTNVEATNGYEHHNVVELNAGFFSTNRNYCNGAFFEGRKSILGGIKYNFNLVYDMKLDENNLKVTWHDAIRRNGTINESEDYIYYFFNDYVNATTPATPSISNVSISINGNGNEFISRNREIDTLKTFRKIGNIYKWDFPCRLDTQGFGLTYHISALNNSTSGKQIDIDTITNNYLTSSGTKASGLLIDEVSSAYMQGNSETYTKLKINQPVNKTIFQSFYYPQKCNAPIPIITKTEDSNFVSTKIRFINGKDTSFIGRFQKNLFANLINDTVCNLHLSRWEGNMPDSLINPFNLPNQNTKKIYFNGQQIFISYHTLSYLGAGYKYCPPTYSNFRQISSNRSNYLVFGNDSLFNSPINIDFEINIAARQLYTCYIRPYASILNDSIKIKLYDVGRGVDMIALKSSNLDTIPSRYDSLNNFLYLKIPSEPTDFTIQEKNLCNSCYFPPVGTNIDTVFLADDGINHTLGRKLAINYPNGQLQIKNSTQIRMCEGVYLLNKDSLIIEGPAQTKGMQIASCAGIDSIAKSSSNSMLIVSPASALVLDAGSRTYVKNGGAIYVKQNGSLVIKDGAFLQIGDSGRTGWGEIIVEAGGNVYIEPNAHIEYRRIQGDTNDRNLFTIALGNNPAFAGVYFIMDSILKTNSILPSTIFPIPICHLDSLNPIYNKEWGYTNFGKPLATFKVRNDTLCPGEPIYIKLNRVLNDASAKITVCRWDSLFINGIFSRMVCIEDSVLLDSIPPDPICRLPRIMPDTWTYYFGVNTSHQVTISVLNECGKQHDTSILIVVSDTPHFTLSVPTTACEGYEQVNATCTINSHDSVFYIFEVTELTDSNSIYYQQGNPNPPYQFRNYGILPTNFNFPGYYFKGGRSYLISLSLTNSCGTRSQEAEVNIPSGVYLELERPTIYSNPVHGARSVQIHGYISSADSFRWEPNLWLNRTDTLVVISSPLDSIYYTLIAKENNCIATDTVFIKYNHVANAGDGDTVCYSKNEVLLGNPYDFSLLFGFLYYKGGSAFRNVFTNYTSSDMEYFKQFTLFMHSDGFKNWANSCNSIYTDFTEDLYREQTIKEPWFISYYELLTQFNSIDMVALDTFTYNINNNPTLQNNYTSTNNWGNYEPCINTLFANYDDFRNNQLNTISMSWIKIVGADTSFNGSLQESALAIAKPTQTTTYIQQVITPYFAEIDETIVWVDTAISVQFAPQFQFDSTVVFQNLSSPIGAGSIFSWNFGDGSPISNLQNPIHQFPKFDSSYIVCLGIQNKCGTYNFCDTVIIDSSHWGGTFKIAVTNNTAIKNSFLNSKTGDDFLINYPNPFDINTTISYFIKDDFKDAKIILTSALGQELLILPITQQNGILKLDGSYISSGLYHCSLLVDGNHKESILISIMH